jgi:hypothetical protein
LSARISSELLGIEFLANAPDFNIGHGRDGGHETEKHDQESHRDLSRL